MSTETKRTCPSCGNEFSGAMEFCPVCMLRRGLAGGVESGESSVEETVRPTSDEPPKRFEHYELVTGEDGKPVELGRGAMGVTYKAFDVDLHCPVTLKVINERYLGEKSAQLRFLREARAAASVRHPNVAWVLHLGRTDQNYFYAKSSTSDISAKNRHSFAFCARRGRRPVFGIQTLPGCYIWAELIRITSTQWSSWRWKRLRTSSNAQAGLR